MGFAFVRRLAMLLLLAGLTPAWGTVALVSADSSGRSLNPQADIFIDPTEQMTLAQVQLAARFEPSRGVIGLGLNRHPVWLRIQLQRGADAPSRWWLEMLPFSVADIRFYRPDETGRYLALTAGERHPFATRGFAYRQYLFPIDLPPGRPVTVYIRLQSNNAVIVPLRLWQLAHWAEQATLEYLLLGAGIGVMLGLGLYNLLLYARLRDRLFLLYFLLMCSYILFVADLHGLASQLLWPDSGYRINGLNQALIALYAVHASLFALWLLQGGGLTRWYQRLMRPLVALYGVTVLAALAGWFDFAAWVIHYAAYPLFVLIICAALYRSVHGFRPALYYLMGYGPVIYSLTLLLLMGQGKVAADSVNQVLYVLAGAWEAILFSQALAERVNLLRHEKEQALQLAFDEKAGRLGDAERHQQELETKVAARTAALGDEISHHKETLEMLRASEAQLTNFAYHDALTGLPNRRMMLDRFEFMTALAKRQRGEFALAVVDLDHFKAINDSYGHDAGDEVLIQLAQKLRQAVRDTDIVGRLGGDEFLLVFSMPLDDPALRALLERIRETAAAPVSFAGVDIACDISIGVAWYGRDGLSFQDLHKLADVALYRVKRAGGKAYCIYAP